LVVGAAGVMFVVLAGTTYQGIATALERRQLPHPGRLIDVGGHQLHLDCLGQGQPTVVLEAPALAMSAAWGWVRQELMSRTRVCAYDRSGLGWSEAGDRPYAPSQAIDELHLLLERSGESLPAVLVGHEFGAALATAYAGRYPADVTGLITIDRAVAGDTGPRSALPRFPSAWPWLARTGVLRATNLMAARAEGLPPESGKALRAFLNRPDHLARSAGELTRWSDTIQAAADTTLDPSLRVVRLDAAGSPSDARLTDSNRAGAVAIAIADLVESVRRGGPPAP
jgi:pimeloyl-ACP methyl ester carboxylesterase